MNRAKTMLRLTPQAAGLLQQQHARAIEELSALTRYNKEFERQLRAVIGYETLRRLRKATDDALLLADLVKEAA
ncbi:hypothetical protein [Pseudomonas extremaustralis]|uniref:hypothetical protein n=1 Tax=Pseudomonas extremaustralis TaxID=359110 RepID=UPI0028583EE5|nr:hypothetical protein [Pseudomonas extremaustralis]MDR6580737.1 hypothetical protein [Pseudomonas extremaustralis]